MDFELALVDSGVITAQDYVDAVRRQRAERVPLGQIAIEEGLISVRRVLELLQQQSENPHKKFGELAVARGYLRLQELAELLLYQEARERPLYEHLIELQRISREQAAVLSEAFSADQRANLAKIGSPSVETYSGPEAPAKEPALA